MEITFPEVLDSSILATFKQCPKKFQYEHVEHWKPRGLSVHLHAGAAFAKGLEAARTAFYCGEYPTYGQELKEGCPPKTIQTGFESGVQGDFELAQAAGMQALITHYGDFQCPADSAKSCERMAGALEYYFEQWPMNWEDSVPILLPGGKRGIEFSFAHPLPINHPQTGNPLIYCGRMDTLISFAGGTYIEDDKTTGSLGASWSRQWDLRSQFTGYAWGCRESRIQVAGVIVRGVAILKTKYDKGDAIVPRSEFDVDRWYDELVGHRGWIEDMLLCWEANKWRHNFDHACADFGGCLFRLPCVSKEDSPWLAQYFERRRWDPITRSETKLGGEQSVEQFSASLVPGAIDLDTPL